MDERGSIKGNMASEKGLARLTQISLPIMIAALLVITRPFMS